MILTNDGEFANRLMHPRYACEKEYLIMVEPGTAGVSPANVRRLREGVELEEGKTAPAKVSQPEPGILRMVISEGKKRQIRRMCALIGHPVTRLVRIRIGSVVDSRLSPGEYRALSHEEVLILSGALPESHRYP
jgi:23S rRNA pseudouridine2605 synthase